MVVGRHGARRLCQQGLIFEVQELQSLEVQNFEPAGCSCSAAGHTYMSRDMNVVEVHYL